MAASTARHPSRMLAYFGAHAESALSFRFDIRNERAIVSANDPTSFTCTSYKDAHFSPPFSMCAQVIM